MALLNAQNNSRKEESIHINNLSFHLKEVEKGDQNKPEASIKKRVIKIMTEINETIGSVWYQVNVGLLS